jgi:signal transduction histidine kinase
MVDFYGETLITSESQLQNHPERVAAFRKASLRGWRYAMENKTELIEHILTDYLTNKEITRVTPSLQNLIDEARLLDEELMHPTLVEIGHMNPQRWQRIADIYVEMGFAEPLTADALNGFIYKPDMPVPIDYTWLKRGITLSLAMLLVLLCFSSVLFFYNRHLTKAVADQTAELTTANQHLENQNMELERFGYTISHELRSPLVTIKSFCGLLQGDIRDQDLESVKEDIECIENASDTMHLLLKNLLELSRIGLVVNETKGVSLVDISQQVIALMKGQLSEKQVEVQVDISSDLPDVEVDPIRFAEVLQNLIENAIKYMGDQRNPRINLGARYEENQLVCFVKDNGIGVEPAFQEKVFGLFEQLDASASGTGVGLALVERIIKSHGGTIWVESEGKGLGATFFFTIDTKTTGILAS